MTDAIDFEAAGVREALASGAELRLLGLLLERPTDVARARRCAVAAEVGDPLLRALAERLQPLEETTYVGLFGPGGPVSPREIAYRKNLDPGWILSEISCSYEAFGYRPLREDPVDHVAVQTGFAAFLRLKQAYARARADGEAVEVTAAAFASFAREHLAVTAAGMATRLRAADAPDLAEVAQGIAARCGVGAVVAPQDGDACDQDEIVCGRCAGQAPPAAEGRAGPPLPACDG
ncbi:MAG: hypothetical protein FJ265_09415 [Planctomycetes bacterium]|nr:hypothetical protein [Planctomycetota bacterium]